jgi:hypothetical protein
MKNILATSSFVTIWALAFLCGCGGDDSSPAGPDKDGGTDARPSGTDARSDARDGRTEASTDGGSCPRSGACGGDIVGTWSITSSCLDVDVSGSIPDYCPTATAKPVDVQIRGTVTYNADLTYSRQIIFSGGVAINFPASCLTTGDAGKPMTCDQLAQELMLDVNYASVSCVAATSGCACTGTLAPQTTQIKTGMYTATSTGLLIETETGRATPDTSDYCIKGSTLSTSPHAMGVMASGMITAMRVAVPDAGSDAMPDAGSDAAPDAGSDAVPADTGSDAVPADTGSDAVPADTGSDAVPDAPMGD